MRKITEQACKALINGGNFYGGNTRVENNAMYLFSNKIAKIENGELHICFCGWDSLTTKERLNGLMELWQYKRPFYTGNLPNLNKWYNMGKRRYC